MPALICTHGWRIWFCKSIADVRLRNDNEISSVSKWYDLVAVACKYCSYLSCRLVKHCDKMIAIIEAIMSALARLAALEIIYPFLHVGSVKRS